MTSRDSAASEITPEVLLRAYACGIFPMAESADDPTLFWVEPELRGVIPLEGFRIASRLARTVRADTFKVTVDTAFKAVIAGCAAPQAGRDDTWINKRIRDLYVGLHAIGHCHSVEVWQDDDLVGGLYGVSLGRAFFGESMFHRARPDRRRNRSSSSSNRRHSRRLNSSGRVDCSAGCSGTRRAPR